MKTPTLASRSCLVCLGLLAAGVGSAQPNYATHWTRTYGTTDDEANAIVAEGTGPLVAFERIYSSNASSAILISYDENGVVKWGTNINSTRASDRHVPIAILATFSEIFVLVRKSTSPLTHQGLLYCFRASDGQKLWSYALSGGRTPQAMIGTGTEVIVATRSIYGEVRATSISDSTGALVREDLLTTNGSVRGGDTGYGPSNSFFYGTSNDRAAYWRSFGSGFASHITAVGSNRATWTAVSKDGLHAFGTTDDYGGSCRALYGYRSNITSPFTVLPLPVPIAADGSLHTSEARQVQLQENMRNRMGYRQVAGNTDIIRRLEADDEGFITSLAPIALPSSATTFQSFTSFNDFHFLGNYGSGPSKVYGVHSSLPNYSFTKANEKIADGCGTYIVSTFEKAPGDRDIALRKMRLPKIPNAMTEYHLAVRTEGEYSTFDYTQALTQGFGNTYGNQTVAFSHGTLGFAQTFSYYVPDLNFSGEDLSTFAVGNPPAPAQVKMLIGFPHKVVGVAFRNLGEVIGGRTIEARLTLSRPAPGGGLFVPMSTNSTLMSVPAQVFVEAGSKTAKFLVSTQKVFSSTSRKVVFGPGPNDFANVILIPGGLNTFNIGPASVKGGNNATGSISMTGPLPTYLPGATISVTANGGGVAFPSSVTLGPGTINKTFTILTSPVALTTVRTFTVTQGVTQLTKTLTITP